MVASVISLSAAGGGGKEVRGERSEDTDALWQSLQMADDRPRPPDELLKAREARVPGGYPLWSCDVLEGSP